MEGKGFLLNYILWGCFACIVCRDDLNDKVVKEMSKKIYSQMETTIVLNNLQESIIIKSDQKIEFVNHNFI